MLTLEDMVQIVKPHNDRVAAEQRVEEREKVISELHAKIFDLKAALGACVALMKHDAEGQLISSTRSGVIETGYRLSRHEL